jgi:hypothetical protein
MTRLFLAPTFYTNSNMFDVGDLHSNLSTLARDRCAARRATMRILSDDQVEIVGYRK